MCNDLTYIIDFDSTIVDCEALDVLAQQKFGLRGGGVSKVGEIARITALGMEGKISYPESLARRMQILQPSYTEILQLTAHLQKHVTNSWQRHAEYIRSISERIHIVSGGFREYIEPVLVTYGICSSHIHANILSFDPGGGYHGYDTTHPLATKEGKIAVVQSLGLSPVHTVVIGDGYTDYQIYVAGLAQSFIAYTEHARRESVLAVAPRVVTSFNEIFVV